MKTLFLIRHAKSNWSDPTLSDFERPLNKRGLKNAPVMAARLAECDDVPELIISSSAVRAKMTAQFFANALDDRGVKLTEENLLYSAGTTQLNHYVQSLDDSINNIAIVAHNPTLTWYANQMAQTDIFNMPTCSVITIRCNTKHWNKISSVKCSCINYMYPKDAH
ncbi:MAG: histidine phosphatase family protein [Gammaproteobacteria bacterium]|nr:histidine phosphatase family protein [Gammaproteobacteria bacterium]